MDNYQKSLKVVNRLVRKSLYENAQSVAIYRNNENDEINTSFILYNHLVSENKDVIWIDEPVFDASGIDLVIIPVSKFSPSGNYISRIKIHNGKKVIGFGYDCDSYDDVISYNRATILTPESGYNA